MYGEYNESCIVFQVPVCSLRTSSHLTELLPTADSGCLFRFSRERSLRPCSQTRRPQFGMFHTDTVPLETQTLSGWNGLGSVMLCLGPNEYLDFVSSFRPPNTHTHPNTLPDPFLQMQSSTDFVTVHERISKEILRC